MLKTGKTQFYHPDGTHDDRLWALALAVYASRPEIPTYKLVIAFGHFIKPWVDCSEMVSPAVSRPPG